MLSDSDFVALKQKPVKKSILTVRNIVFVTFFSIFFTQM